MKRMILLLALAAITARAEVVGELKGLIIEAATTAELEETVFPAFYAISRADSPNDLRIGDGVTPGGLRVCPEGVLTNIPNSFPHAVAMNGNTINLNGAYAIGAEGPHCYIRSNGSNVLSILAQTAGIGETISTEYAGNDTLRVTIAVDDSAADPLVEYSPSITDSLWTDCVYVVTRPTTNTMQIDITIPSDADDGYFRITSLSGFRVRFSIPVEVPALTANSLTIGDRTWTNLPESLAESDPVWLAERSNYATGTPLYAYTETDPVWLAERSNYATGTPLYAYTETDPVWIAERANYATGTPLYAYTESDPVWLAEKSNYATGTPLYAYTETDPVWIAERSNYATGTPLYVESDPVWLAERSNYATGTPLYAFSEADPAFTDWLDTNTYVQTESDPVFLAQKAQFATGTPLYVESDPVWVAERSNYATGTPLYAYTETDPLSLSAAGGVLSGDLLLAKNATNKNSYALMLLTENYSGQPLTGQLYATRGFASLNYAVNTPTGRVSTSLRTTLDGQYTVPFYLTQSGGGLPETMSSTFISWDITDYSESLFGDYTLAPNKRGSLLYSRRYGADSITGHVAIVYADESLTNLYYVHSGTNLYFIANNATGKLVVAYSGNASIDGNLIAAGVYDANSNGVSGYGAMQGATNCTENAVSGGWAMQGASDCYHNAAIGRMVLYMASNCTYNATLGKLAMRLAQNCERNSAVGDESMDVANGLDRCVAVGQEALKYATNCKYAVAAGHCAMASARLATNSAALGSWAGRNATGTGRGYIDCYTADPGDAHNPTNDLIFFDNGSLYVGRGTAATNKIVLRYLPATDPGVAGQLWQVGSNLYISTGQ